MRILILGICVLCAWSALSRDFYVCKMRGLCYEPKLKQIIINKQSHEKDSMLLAAVKIAELNMSTEYLIVNFSFDNSIFIADGESNDYFNASNQYLHQNLQSVISITGHTDAVGTSKYNHALGYRRAQSLKYYFESKGIPADRIIISSKGEMEPVDDNKTITGMENNRRAVVILKKTR